MKKSPKKLFYGWSRTTRSKAREIHSMSELSKGECIISRGAGLSYGDAALNKDNSIITLETLKIDNEFFAGDKSIIVKANQTILQTLSILKSYNRSLAVIPGTSRATIGGCVAANVHGKNHHIEGSFSEQVVGFWLQIDSSASEIYCSDKQNHDLFVATFGSHGLTGNLTKVHLKTVEISSAVEVELDFFNDLESMFQIMHELSRGDKSFISLINWSGVKRGSGKIIKYKNLYDANLTIPTPKFSTFMSLSFPFINPISIRAYNILFFKKSQKTTIKHPHSLWFMADRHKNANLWFGKNGFIEYQFSLPWSGKLIAMEVMRDFERHFTIYLSGAKVFGNKSKGLIDFTQEGFTVTLTTKPTSKLYSKLIEFDKKILQNGGRIYLAKDSRLDSDTFARMYPRVEELRSLRSKYNLEMFSSDLSRRLKI